MAGINIPVGISDFEKIRRNGYYYVDKTGLIPELLRGQSLLLNPPPLVPVNGIGFEVPLELLEAPPRPVPVEFVLQAPGQQLRRMSSPSRAAGPGRVRAPFGLRCARIPCRKTLLQESSAWRRVRLSRP